MSKHCRQICPRVVRTSWKTVSLFLFCMCFAAEKPRAFTMHNIETVSTLARFKIMRPGSQMTLQHFQMNVAQNNLFCFFSFQTSSKWFCHWSPIQTSLFHVIICYLRGKKKGFLQHLATVAWVKSHFRSDPPTSNVTWRHIIYSFNCWNPNHALNGNTLKTIPLCLNCADTSATSRGLQREDSFMFL